MKSLTFGIAFVALVNAVAIDNTHEAAEIHSKSSTLSGAGDYSFVNVATGKTLSFTRDDGAAVTNVFAVENGTPLAVQFGNDGQARLSGGNNKCVSAQWDVAFEGGVDNAAVSYACAVGSGQLTGTATLERTKQWWYLVPAGEGSSDDISPPPAAPQREDSAPAFLAAKHDAPSSPAPSRFIPAVALTPALVSAPPSTLASTSILDKNPDNDLSRVVKTDRATWICRHDGSWLVRHPKYVTEGGHTECAADLAAAQQLANASRMVRRAPRSHSQMAANLRKRGSQQYFLIAVDHLHDMATRAITGHKMSTPGGYTSAVLSLWNKSDPNQLWTITR